MTQYELLSIAISIIGFVTVVISVWYLARQTKMLSVSLADTPYATISTQMFAVDQIFIEHPELRPYFYEYKPLTTDDPVRQQVLAVAEALLDFSSGVIDQQQRVQGSFSNDWWASYFRDLFARSPVLCCYLAECRHWYPAELYGIMCEAKQADSVEGADGPCTAAG